MKTKKEKKKIIVDLDSDIKEYFQERIKSLDNNKINTTVLLKAAIFHYLKIDNEDLKRFINDSEIFMSGIEKFKDLINSAKKEKLLPQSYKIGHSRTRDINTVLFKLEEKQIDSDEAKNQIEQIYWEEWLKTKEGTDFMFSLMRKEGEISKDEAKKETKDKWFK